MTIEAMTIEGVKPGGLKLRDATKADFDAPALHNPQTGIFHGVSEATLDHVLSTSSCPADLQLSMNSTA